MAKTKIKYVAGALAVLNSLMFHFPFFSYVLSHLEGGPNAVFITASLAAIMLAANYFAFYLLLYAGRAIGKVLVGLLFVGNAVSLYFINTYDVMIDDSMMGNVFNTDFAEATSYWSWTALLYIVLMGILPFVLIMVTKIDYGKFRKFLANIGVSLAIIAAAAFANMPNWTWVDNNSTIMGSLILPWSYIVNAVRFKNAQRENNREEIALPDASIGDSTKSVVVLVIGESSRRDHYSLYGYGRNTNPLLGARHGIKAYKANSSATYTTGGVKAILSNSDSDKLYEILPNYLYRTGTEVCWRTSNWGQPPLHISHYYETKDLADLYPQCNSDFDEILTKGLKEVIGNCGKDKALIILHTSTSHGPEYSRKYPPEFEVFSPVCNTVEMAKCPKDQLINAYDNSIVYTDYVLDRVCCELEGLEDWEKCMIFVSDHGESLGENNLYMHGVPVGIAPAEQYEIPFIVWYTGEKFALKNADMLSQYHVFHSVLHFLAVDSPVYDPEFDIFR